MLVLQKLETQTGYKNMFIITASMHSIETFLLLSCFLHKVVCKSLLNLGYHYSYWVCKSDFFCDR